MKSSKAQGPIAIIHPKNNKAPKPKRKMKIDPIMEAVKVTSLEELSDEINLPPAQI